MSLIVMPGLVPGIHVLTTPAKEDVDGRDIGERSDAVLRTAMPGHDESGEVAANIIVVIR
ncbi:MAG: hypothetical protein ACTHNN_12700 [Xanthobacteraceae bacterium]